MSDKSDVTIKIPRQLYEKLQLIIGETGFHSVTEFVVYVLRDLVSTDAAATTKSHSKAAPSSLPQEAELTAEEIRLIRKRLQDLGYL
jgi:metal-responsive CopG/Arc/MetJ family transcriptional regulator